MGIQKRTRGGATCSTERRLRPPEQDSRRACDQLCGVPVSTCARERVCECVHLPGPLSLARRMRGLRGRALGGGIAGRWDRFQGLVGLNEVIQGLAQAPKGAGNGQPEPGSKRKSQEN